MSRRLRDLTGAVNLAALAAIAAASSRPLAAGPVTDVCGPLAASTVWSAASSPYRTTCDVVVPAGTTLRIEPGTVVQLGEFDTINVGGALDAVGSSDQLIQFAAAVNGQPWGGIQLLAGSGPSEITHAVFTGGGARRREMLGIAADAALVRNTRFSGGAGVAIEVKDGASPTVRDSVFDDVSDRNATPPAALRVLGPSQATITGNFFKSNDMYGVFWEANASPRFAGNRFEANGRDGVLVYGDVSRSVSLPSLGSRGWAYHLTRGGVRILPAGLLNVNAGATLRFDPGTGLRVQGTLAVRGHATRKVRFAAEPPNEIPGQWLEIRFEDGSVDYDPVTGSGSIIDHAVLENGGANQSGLILIQNSSPRIAHTTVRRSANRGVTVTGAAAKPAIAGLVLEDNVEDPDGSGLFVSDGAAPEVSFSVFRRNFSGLTAEKGSAPRISPHNRFADNLTFGVRNADPSVCLDATGNEWGAATGPDDPSSFPDACNQADHRSTGALVSDHVRYLPFDGQLPAPTITAPRCGTTADTNPRLAGYALPDSTVTIFDNEVSIGTTQTEASAGDLVAFTFVPPTLAAGSHVLQARAERGAEASGLSEPLLLDLNPNQLVDPAGIFVRYDLDGTRFVQPLRDATGCATLPEDGGWAIRAHPGAPLTLSVPLHCASDPARGSIEYLGASYPLEDQRDGTFNVTFDMGDGGPLSLSTACRAVSSEGWLATVSPEYHGFVYNAVARPDPFLARVAGAIVTLRFRDPAAPVGQQWKIWPAQAYFGQTNPQMTGLGGWYAFYPPPGEVRLEVEAEGYQPHVSAPFPVTVDRVVLDIGLTPLPRRPAVYLPALANQASLGPARAGQAILRTVER